VDNTPLVDSAPRRIDTAAVIEYGQQMTSVQFDDVRRDAE
jgi:hypothetical protein